MTGLFDGMAGALNQMFGAPIIHTPVGGSPVSVQGVFRETPITVADDEGRDILLVAPTLQVLVDVAATLTRKDSIDPQNGKTYRVLNKHPSGSPASDAFVIVELEQNP